MDTESNVLQILQEPDTEICAAMLDALNECIQVGVVLGYLNVAIVSVRRMLDLFLSFNFVMCYFAFILFVNIQDPRTVLFLCSISPLLLYVMNMESIFGHLFLYLSYYVH